MDLGYLGLGYLGAGLGAAFTLMGAGLAAFQQSSAYTKCFSDIAPERLQWLWPGRIPLGKVTVIAGDPGLGKSLVTLDLAARVSRPIALSLLDPQVVRSRRQDVVTVG